MQVFNRALIIYDTNNSINHNRYIHLDYRYIKIYFILFWIRLLDLGNGILVGEWSNLLRYRLILRLTSATLQPFSLG